MHLGSIDDTLLMVLFKRDEDDNYVECIRYINLIGNLIENNNIKLRFDYDKDSKKYKTNFILEYTGAPSYTYAIIMNNDEKYYYITEEHSYQLLEGKTLNSVDVYAVGGPWAGLLTAGTDKQSIPYLADLKIEIDTDLTQTKLKTAELKFAKYLENNMSSQWFGMGYYQNKSEDLSSFDYALKYDTTDHMWKLYEKSGLIIAITSTLVNTGGYKVKWERVDDTIPPAFKTYIYDDNESGGSFGFFDILNSSDFDKIIE